MLKILAVTVIVLAMAGVSIAAFATAYYPVAMLAVSDAGAGAKSVAWHSDAPFISRLVYDHIYSDVTARGIINDRLRHESEQRRARWETDQQTNAASPPLSDHYQQPGGITWWPYAAGMVVLAALVFLTLKGPRVTYATWRRASPGVMPAASGATADWRRPPGAMTDA